MLPAAVGRCAVSNYLGLYRRARRGQRGARIDHKPPRRGKRLEPYDRNERRLIVVELRRKDAS